MADDASITYIPDPTGPTGGVEPFTVSLGSSGETGPTGTSEPFVVYLSGSQTAEGTGAMKAYFDSLGTAGVDQETVSLSDILADVSTYRYRETLDRAKFLGLLNPNVGDMKTKLAAWVAGGFRGSCDLFCIQITAPNVCSDGASRSLFEYIEFVSGKTYLDHINKIQSILTGFEVGYRCSPKEFVICVYGVKE